MSEPQQKRTNLSSTGEGQMPRPPVSDLAAAEAAARESGDSRRRFVKTGFKAGLAALPVVWTLRSRPAWGQSPVAIGTNVTGANNSVETSEGVEGAGADPEMLGAQSRLMFDDPWASDGGGGAEEDPGLRLSGGNDW